MRGTPSLTILTPASIGLTPAGAGNTPLRSSCRASTWAHPRGCGEHIDLRQHPRLPPGSPPRVRGTPSVARPDPGSSGLTPAGAGNTAVSASPPRATVAHPRGCGEHHDPQYGWRSVEGSPPRVRGTRPGRRGPGLAMGLTPAGAGNTRTARQRRPARWAHPRGVRGTLPYDPPHTVLAGLTPAGAGNTELPRGTCATCRAHPRGCGEHYLAGGVGGVGLGSPPRVRGTPRRRRPVIRAGGLTPAGAGNTRTAPRTSPPQWAHPRGCGEHAGRARPSALKSGSPPRVRGTRGLPPLVEQEHGLTPAGAGNTGCHPTRTALCRAHPRGCGEHHQRPASGWCRPGSPPRVRGTPHALDGIGDAIGLTPAGAGNTTSSRRGRPRSRAHPRGCGEHRVGRCARPQSPGSPPRVRGTL